MSEYNPIRYKLKKHGYISSNQYAKGHGMKERRVRDYVLSACHNDDFEGHYERFERQLWLDRIAVYRLNQYFEKKLEDYMTIPRYAEERGVSIDEVRSVVARGCLNEHHFRKERFPISPGRFVILTKDAVTILDKHFQKREDTK